MDPAERVALIQQAPLLADPGARWQYSSPGYVLAGHIVAQASGQPYTDFLAGRVLDPLRLTATSSGGVPAGVAVARGTRALLRQLVPAVLLASGPERVLALRRAGVKPLGQYAAFLT